MMTIADYPLSRPVITPHVEKSLKICSLALYGKSKDELGEIKKLENGAEFSYNKETTQLVVREGELYLDIGDSSVKTGVFSKASSPEALFAEFLNWAKTSVLLALSDDYPSFSRSPVALLILEVKARYDFFTPLGLTEAKRSECNELAEWMRGDGAQHMMVQGVEYYNVFTGNPVVVLLSDQNDDHHHIFIEVPNETAVYLDTLKEEKHFESIMGVFADIIEECGERSERMKKHEIPKTSDVLVASKVLGFVDEIDMLELQTESFNCLMDAPAHIKTIVPKKFIGEIVPHSTTQTCDVKGFCSFDAHSVVEDGYIFISHSSLNITVQSRPFHLRSSIPIPEASELLSLQNRNLTVEDIPKIVDFVSNYIEEEENARG